MVDNKGGKFLFGGVRDTRIITFTGTNATGSIITNDLEYGYNSVITLIRPSVDNGSANVQVASRRMLDDTITYGSSVSASQEDRCSVRSAGRWAGGARDRTAKAAFQRVSIGA